MRKTLLSIMLLSVGLYNAQVTIGTGTRVDTNGGLSTPISIYYGYSLSQQIYLASEIGGPLNITELKFYVQNAPTSLSNTGSVDVWLGHTTQSGFQNTVSTTGAGWIPVSQQQKLLTSGSLSLSGNVITITLSSPFAYNGTDNLIITVDENIAGNNGSSSSFYQTVDSANDMTILNRNDSANPDPTNPPTNYTGPTSTSTSQVQSKKYKAILTLISQNLGVVEAKTVGDATVSPNPTTDFVTIKSKLNVNSVDVFDLNGRIVLNSTTLINDQIDLRELSAGIYILKINYKEGVTSTKKIIKK